MDNERYEKLLRELLDPKYDANAHEHVARIEIQVLEEENEVLRQMLRMREGE